MTIKMKQIGKVKNNCFEVEIEYTHANGSIDFKTFTKQILDTSDISELEKFISFFKESAFIISESKNECEQAPQSFEKQLKKIFIYNKYIDIIEVPESSLYVIVTQDYTDDGEGDYTVYAEMNIKKIIFIDADMKIFDVIFK